MARAVEAYRRLPGRKRTFIGAVTLWLGADHLLLVENRWFTELYRRFYFRDLQAVILRPTPRFAAWAVVDGMLATLASMWLATAVSTGWRIFWMCVLVPVAGALLVHLLRGPTCVCHFQTPLEAVEVRCLDRSRRARRVLKLLRPLIERDQGPLVAADAAGDVASATQAATQAAIATRPPAALPPLPVRREAGRAHVALFGLLLLDATLTLLQIGTSTTRISGVAALVLLAQVGCVIAALIKQRGSELSPAVRRTTWLCLVYVCVVWMTNNGLTIVDAVLAGIDKDRPLGLGPLNWVYGIEACVALVLGAAGMLILRVSRESTERIWLNLSS